MSTSAWVVAAVVLAVLIGLVVAMLSWPRRRRKPAELPSEWPLMQRSIFTAEERALYRQLRAALPHHTILAKLPLVRFCQPIERGDLRYWFELLGPIHVSFVVCAENGRALAALDIERPQRSSSARVQKIKQSVLDACRIRYVKCSGDQLPTAAELQLLVPHQGEAHRPWMPNSNVVANDMRSTLAHAVRSRRADTETQWVDSGYAADSFFAPDASPDALPDTGAGPLTPPAPAPRPSDSKGRWAGTSESASRRGPNAYGSDEDGTHIIGRM